MKWSKHVANFTMWPSMPFTLLLLAAFILLLLSLPGHTATLDGIRQPLAAKTRQILLMCKGSRLVSGYRRTYIAGTHHMSLHSKGRAVDIQGNYKCIVRQLDGWPGGFTTDYYKMKHIHVSYGGPEHGLRFVHGGHSRRHVHGLRWSMPSAGVYNDRHRVR